MRLRSVAHLYRVRLRSRLVQELLALAGITVGVALVFAALVANTSLTGSIRQLTEGIVGDATLQIAARGPDGFDRRVLRKLERMPEVETIAPILETRANVVGPKGRRSVLLVGGDTAFASLDGTMLPHYAAAELGRQRTLGLPLPMAADLGLSLGQPLVVEIGGRAVRLPLGAQLQATDIGALVESPIALASMRTAQRISGMEGRVSRAFVKPRAGAGAAAQAALTRAVGDRLNVGTADTEVAVFERAAYPTNQSIALFSVFSALVGFLFAFSAVLLTVPQRRRLIADLRLAGHEPWVLVQVLLFDAVVLGVAGSVLGLAVGDQLSRHLFDSAPNYLAAAFAVGSQRIVTAQSVAIACTAGVAAACLAVLVPVRDILARHPVSRAAASTGGRAEAWSALAGLACLAVTTLIVVVAPDAALAGLITLTLALLLLLPILLRAVVAGLKIAGRPLKSPVPVLAILELRSRSTHLRTLAVAATGAIAVFATVAIGGAHADLERGLQMSARDIDGNADLWVSFAGPANVLATTAFETSRSDLAELRRTPGVADVRPYRGGFLDIGDRRTWVLAPARRTAAPIPVSQVRAGDARLANQRVRRGGWIAISEAVADAHQVGVGDRITIPAPRTSSFRVAAVTTNLAWPPGALVLNARDYAEAWGSDAVSGLHVDVAAGSSATAVKAAVESSLGDGRPLLVETSEERTQRHYGTARDALSRLTQISILVLISAVLAMAAAMGGMIWQRRDTFAALKVHGYPDAELWRGLLLESTLLLGAGCVFGAAFGLFGQLLMSRALEAITGFPVVYNPAGLAAATILALVTLLSVAIVALPGWLAVRVRPAPGLTR